MLDNKSIREEIVKTLFTNYQNQERPGERTQNQTVVTVYISISAITSVDVRNMEYKVDMLLRQSWHDPRLAWNHIPRFKNCTDNIVSPVFKERIWIPDLFFRNGKEGKVHKITNDNLFIRIQPDGIILYSQKITMRLACQMDLRTFPMDTQECGMNIGSYGYELRQLRFVWRPDNPVALPKDLQISEFDPPDRVDSYDCTAGYSTSTGNYSCLNSTFILSRQLGYWLASTYIPNILIMVVSWLNFWVSVDAVPARVNLSLLTLLGIITQSTGYASILPRVSYIKAIDVWTIACIAFNSGVLLEFAIASHLARRCKVTGWQTEIRKTVRDELVKWCCACQEQYLSRGPSASMSYLLSGSYGSEKAQECVNTAAAAAFAIQKLPAPESPSQMSVHLTKSGLQTIGAERRASAKSSDGKFSRSNTWKSDSLRTVSVTESAQTEALLPPNQEKKGREKATVSTIDNYSRFVFPACFLLYNTFYWLYYLVIVKHY